MMRCASLLIAIVLTGCALHEKHDQSAIRDGEDDVRMSVRKVEIPSDIAVIRPDYQIVIGSVSRTVPMDRKVIWDRPLQPVIGEQPKANSGGSPTNTSAPETKAEQTVYLNETHFEFGSARLTKSAMDILDRTAVEIERLAPRKLAIVGHTDSVGGQAGNQKLSERRAEAVFGYLHQRGMKVEKVDRVGFGETAPVASNGTPDGRAKNRRAEIMATVSK
ncbi:OmpA family protein [Noviherbaspirillum sp. CPCC 100848]|uniref:OmpA family protein n=1 Tax=Noviherbaspirillum album TaxID=3080276 RepID=A0ABU6J4D5_9BURK|nr:OmpA family protein [Noviherbaspirillum sp. CPCC 100848]MEC4718197.1 OmpA family protein [Noviherbaspirillum sp. CPCC 100848]